MKKEKHNIPILIGENLKNIRISLGLTQEEVAESLGLAPRYLSDIERNKTKGSITTLVKLCNLYKVTPTVVLKDYLSTSDSNLDDSISGFNNLFVKFFNNSLSSFLIFLDIIKYSLDSEIHCKSSMSLW